MDITPPISFSSFVITPQSSLTMRNWTQNTRCAWHAPRITKKTSRRSWKWNKNHGTSQTNRIENLVWGFLGTQLSDVTNKPVQILTRPVARLTANPQSSLLIPLWQRPIKTRNLLLSTQTQLEFFNGRGEEWRNLTNPKQFSLWIVAATKCSQNLIFLVD